MCPLAFGFSGHEAFIFQVELDFLSRLAQFQQFGLAPMVVCDAAGLAQNLPDGGLPTWQTHTSSCEHRITVEERQEGFWSWDALQILGWLHSHLQDALHDGGLRGDGGRWTVPGRRSGVQRPHISRIGLALPPEPLAHPRA
jgi:hypothetical protein